MRPLQQFPSRSGIRTAIAVAAAALLARGSSAAQELGLPRELPQSPSAGAVTAEPLPDARLDVAQAMILKGAFSPAAVSAATVLRERPELDRAAALLGIALNKLKRYDEARPYLRRALDSAQNFPERRHVAHFLGWSSFHLGELDESRRSFERHLRDVPGEPDSTFGLGLVALAEDRIDDAQAHFMGALEGFSKPEPKPVDQSRVLVRLADVALRRDDVIWAEELLGYAIDASPVQHEAWAKLARVRDRLGKHDEAEVARANERRILEARGRVAPTSAPVSSAPPPPVRSSEGSASE